MAQEPLFVDRPVLIGHRGSGKGVVRGHRENTLDSFAAAVEAGLTWVEADARACGDGALAVAHNPTVPDGRSFADMTGDEAVAAGSLLVEDLLDWLPEGVGLDLEVKTSLEDAARPREGTTAARLAPVAARERERRPILVTSFDPAALLILREHAKDVAIGLLTWVYFPLRKAVPAALHLGCQVLAAHWGSFGANSVDSVPAQPPAARAVAVARQAGLEVVAWSPGPEEARHLVDAGVDALVVNDVFAVRSAVGDVNVPTGEPD